MKKILSLLGAIGLTVTTGSTIIACGTQTTEKNKNDNQGNNDLKVKIDELETKIKELEDEIQKIKDDHAEIIKEKDDEIQKIKDDHAEIIKELEDEIQKIKDDHAEIIKEKDDEIKKLKDEIEKLKESIPTDTKETIGLIIKEKNFGIIPLYQEVTVVTMTQLVKEKYPTINLEELEAKLWLKATDPGNSNIIHGLLQINVRENSTVYHQETVLIVFKLDPNTKQKPADPNEIDWIEIGIN